jgi:hypothetical protein
MVIKKRDTIQFYNSYNKKGSSHFEILISFVLFVGFTLFLLFTLEPTKKDLLEESILFNVQNEFFEQTITNVSYVLVDYNKNKTNEKPDTCKDDNYNKVCYPPQIKDDGYRIFVPIIDKPCVSTIYASNEFGSSTVTKECKNDESDNSKYLIGYIYREDVLSNKSLISMRNKYYSDYANLKDIDLKVPEVVDFAIVSSDTSFNMTKTIPDEAEVIAGTYRKKVLYANGSIVNHDFTIKVW